MQFLRNFSDFQGFEVDLDQIMVKFWAEFDLGLNFVKLRVASPVRISPFTLLSPKIGILDRKLKFNFNNYRPTAHFCLYFMLLLTNLRGRSYFQPYRF